MGSIEPRPWWLLRLQSLGLVLIGSVALLALAFLVVLGPLILEDGSRASLPGRRRSAHAARLRPHRRSRRRCSRFRCSLAHLILPAQRPRCFGLLPGVALTFIASIVFGEAFGAYLSQFVRNYISTYAGLASAMIALVYLYWVALLFVFGGELNAAIMRDREERSR